MPYITEDRRKRLTEHGLPYVSDVGELEFVVTKIAEELLWKLCDYDWSKLTRAHIAVVTGAMTNATFEFQRRIVAPYKDALRERNGDIFVYPNPEAWDISDPEDEVTTASPAGALEALEGGASA